MQTVNIHDAKTHLSRLLARIATGESIIIARAGTPVAKLVPVGWTDAPSTSRIGFMTGEFTVPDDFDTLMQGEIEAMFYGDDQQ